MILLDTHAWIWWVSSPDQLSSPAIEAVRAGAERRELYISSISAWEVAMLVKKGRLRLTLDVADWIGRCEALPLLSFVPVDNTITVLSTRLDGYPHDDPADRIIISTAQILGATLVTRDEKIRAYKRVKTLW